MFSPRPNGGPVTRTLRRQRPSSENPAQQPKAKRQRLPVPDATFASPAPPAASVGDPQHHDQENYPPEMLEVKPDRLAKLDARPDGAVSLAVVAPPASARKELAVRSKKSKLADRTSKGDASIVLTSNSAFVVSKLPALPDRIRLGPTVQHGSVDSATGYALSLTHTHAVMWPYASSSVSPETFIFNLPYPSKHSSDPLPVGCLVSPSASSTEPGLVVVMPLTGRITYWESISTAATLDFMKKERQGVEASVSGMFSSEKVTHVANAEPAGFVLSFSTGRAAYMSLRDGHGRPAVTTQFMRTGGSGLAGGLFGSLRHALGTSTTRGELAAVHASSPLRVGERKVVALTAKGRVNAWKIHRGGHHEALADADLRADVLSAIRNADVSALEYPEDSFEALDFAFVPRGIAQKHVEMSRLSNALSAAADDDRLLHLVLLVGLTRRRTSRYVMIEIILDVAGCSSAPFQTGLVRPVLYYSTPVAQQQPITTAAAAAAAGSPVRPRLFLPRPALVAFVVFEHAVVVASLALPSQSADAQLLQDSHILPSTYEDVVDFRDDDVSRVVGCGSEEPPTLAQEQQQQLEQQQQQKQPQKQQRHTSNNRAKNPSVLLMVRGTGVLRVTTTDVERFGAGDDAPRVTAKSKLEQAVFFGVCADSPLVFDRRSQVEFSDAEYAEAALQLSDEILSSSSPYMSSLPLSIEENLTSRLASLEKLVGHLKAVGVALDRPTRWRLYAAAEKLYVSTSIWKRHGELTANRPPNDKTTLVARIVELVHEDQKTIPNAARGQVDHVRHWFMKDIAKLGLFVAWCYEAIKHLSTDNLQEHHQITVLIHEAVHIVICAFTSGREFRDRSLAVYGLQDEEFELGILRTGYDGIPVTWTAEAAVVSRLRKLVELCRKWVDSHLKLDDDDRGHSKAGLRGSDPTTLLRAIRKEIPLVTDMYLTSLLELSRFSAAADDEAKYRAECHDQTIALVSSHMWKESAAVAEKHRAWKALAIIQVDHIHCLVAASVAASGRPDGDGEPGPDVLTDEREKVDRMIKKHGQPFAFALYEALIATDGIQGVLDYKGDEFGYKTRFLRSRPELARVSWINEVENEHDVDKAADILLHIGLTEERQVWSKKIELSLGKLALMAEAQTRTPDKTGAFFGPDVARHDRQMKVVEMELGVIRIQDRLYRLVHQTVGLALDSAAEFGLALDVHGAHVQKKQQKALRDLFENGMRRLLAHQTIDPPTLIDILSLLSLSPEQQRAAPDFFYEALLVAQWALKGEELDLASRLVWRRCFVRDDWARINDTTLKNDREVAERLSRTALFSTLGACYQHKGPEVFKFYTPTQALGTYVDSLDRRFDDQDKTFCERLMSAMRAEDALLRKYIDRHRLEEWAQSTANAARRSWALEMDEATTNGAAAGIMPDEDYGVSDSDEVDMIRTNGLVTPPPGLDEKVSSWKR